MRYLAWLMASLLTLALGCADSKALPAEDDDNDSSADSDSDSDSDTDSDSDSDTGTGSSTECQCSNPDIACCDGCYYEGTDVECDSDYNEEYGCPWGSDCGGSVGKRYQPRMCPGDVAACIGDVGEWGDWIVDDECGPIEVCDSTDFVCAPDMVTCPVDFGDQVCVAGGFMADCGIFGCSDPPPSITEVLDFASLGTGEVVLLEISTPIRGTGLFDPGLPFSDISATLTHGTTTASFFNQNNGIDLGTIFGSYEFPSTWYLPHFWGQEMGGTWTLYFEDHEFSMNPFDLTEWCITFLDPSTTSSVTSGTWSDGDTGDIYGSDTPPATSLFDLQIDDIVDATSLTPVLTLSASHPTPTDLEIELIAADGTVHLVKAQSASSIPTTYDITGMTSNWLTGRWSLRCTNYATLVDGSVSSWSISL